ncbi:hypothetical protein CsSME_00008866 [Camellia sinensis var. sinensis]
MASSTSISLILLLIAVVAGASSATTFSDENPIRTVVSDALLRDLETSVLKVIGHCRHALSFARFAHRYGKRYETPEDMKLRFSIFSENLKLIKSHNKKKLSYTLGVNHFSDWTWEEFRKHRLGAAQNCSATTRGNHKLTDEVLPNSVLFFWGDFLGCFDYGTWCFQYEILFACVESCYQKKPWKPCDLRCNLTIYEVDLS